MCLCGYFNYLFVCFFSFTDVPTCHNVVCFVAVRKHFTVAYSEHLPPPPPCDDSSEYTSDRNVKKELVVMQPRVQDFKTKEKKTKKPGASLVLTNCLDFQNKKSRQKKKKKGDHFVVTQH